jgi:hypothetical protein
MTDKVVSLDAYRSDPHFSGTMICLVCDHEGVGVAPVGTEWLECPQCHTHRATPMYPVQRSDELHLTCMCCGNGLMAVTPGMIYCTQCGANVMEFEE